MIMMTMMVSVTMTIIDYDDDDGDNDSKGDSRAGCYGDEDEQGVGGCEQHVLKYSATTDITTVRSVCHIFIINSLFVTTKALVGL